MKHLKNFNESIYEREVVFTNKRNPRLVITIKKSPDGRITNIENETGIRFPFSIGQLLQRNVEVWACNNNFSMDGKDTYEKFELSLPFCRTKITTFAPSLL